MTAGLETIPTGGFFFFEPEAKRFVRDETKRLPLNGCMLLALIPFVLSGLLLLSLSVLQWIQIIRFSSSKWVETKGTYVSQNKVARAAGRRPLRSFALVFIRISYGLFCGLFGLKPVGLGLE